MLQQVHMRPVEATDYPFLRAAEFARLGPGWRSRGFVHSPEDFAARVWSGSIAQLLGVLDDGMPVGWYQAYNADFAAGHCEVALARLDTFLDNRAFLAGAVSFVDHLFDSWTLEKLYFEVPEFNYDHVAGFVGGQLAIEGRRLAYLAAHGRLWDLITLSLSKVTWTSDRRFSRFRPNAPGAGELQ